MAQAKAACEERRRRWAELVSKWQGSGMGQATFCREEGLNANPPPAPVFDRRLHYLAPLHFRD